MSLFAEPYTVCHIPRRPDTSAPDRNGNYPLRPLPPVIRTCQELAQKGGGNSKAITSTEDLQGTETWVLMACSDVTPYRDQDQVLIGGAVDESGNYVDGIAYVVDGQPADDTHGFLGQAVYKSLGFGGTVNLKRIT
jgi:hypothetical protein